MGRIALDGGNFVVHFDDGGDVRQYRVALRGADGAEQIEPADDAQSITIKADDEFNVIALWMTGFEWEHEALIVAFELITPLAKHSLHIHSRSHSRMMHRRIEERRPPRPPRDRPDRPDRPGSDR